MLERIKKTLSYAALTTISILLITLLIRGPETPFTIISHGIETEEYEKFDQSYAAYNALLSRYVSDGRVNYEGFIESRSELEKFLNSMGSVDPEELETWSEQEKLAFWINAYNAFTIKVIIDNYPIKRSFSLVGIFYAPSNSILQIKGVWDKLQYRVAGRLITLGDIEHEILRKDFNEPRIHMAIVCASISCPDLANQAYTGDEIEEQLTEASVRFINNPDKGALIDEKDNRVKVSKIFKWFGEDFIKNYGKPVRFRDESLKNNSVLNFVSEYLVSDNQKGFIDKGDFKFSYLKYDWHLNDMPES